MTGFADRETIRHLFGRYNANGDRERATRR